MKNNKKGFTLIELLVVIAIIGLLSTLAVVALNNARQKSRDAKRVADVKQLQTALELYFNDKGSYPAGTAAVLGASAAGCMDDNGFGTPPCATDPIYMAQVPSDPQAPHFYEYNAAASETNYSIEFFLEGDTGGLTGDQMNTACAGGISGCTAF